MSFQYSDLQNFSFQHFPGLSATDAQYVQFEPRAIEYAELRCYRDLDLQVTRKFATSQVVTGNPLIEAPTDLVVLRGLSFFTPQGTTVSNGTRITLKRRDERFLGRYWPDRSQTAPPKFYALINWPQLLLAPTPDQNYELEMAYTYRPPPLGQDFTASPLTPLPVGWSQPGGDGTQITSTYLTTFFPDLFLAAFLVHLSGAFKNYGASSEDPRVALSWENRYTTALQSAMVEEGRRRSQVYADLSRTQPPAATSPN